MKKYHNQITIFIGMNKMVYIIMTVIFGINIVYIFILANQLDEHIRKSNKKCEWIGCEIQGGWYWETKCGVTGVTDEHSGNYIFCPFCGRRIQKGSELGLAGLCRL